MSTKFIVSIIFICCSLKGFSQENSEKHSVKDYPDGYYMTLEDFLAKKVIKADGLIRSDVKTRKVITAETNADQAFFIMVSDSAKVKKAFAISYNRDLYFRQAFFTKYASKGDRVDAAVNPNSYHRVIMDGNFFYMEAVFANTWKTAVSSNMGIAGSAMASSAYQLKPIVFNFETQRFDLFRNCEDFNAFLASRDSPNVVNCDSRYITLEKMKAVLEDEIKR